MAALHPSGPVLLTGGSKVSFELTDSAPLTEH